MNTSSKIKSVKISVVTVVYNCAATIEKTMQSVINQSYSNIEYIIIDGKSIDGTLGIINRYNKYICKIVSESDHGIYDAMNKGIRQATGDYLIFMNSGDVFISDLICEKVAKKIKETDIFYGDSIAIDEESRIELMIKAKRLNSIYRGMIFSHQSVFTKLELLKKHPFDIRFQISADFEQYISFFLEGYKFKYFPQIVSKTQIGGLSYSNLNTLIEKIKILVKKKVSPLFFILMVPEIFVGIVRKIVGTKIVMFIRKVKWGFKQYKVSK